MNEPDTNPDPAPLLDDDAIARLIEDAGRRPPVEREDLDAIAATARAAWHARGERERDAVSIPELRDRRLSTPRRGSRAAVALALAAALAALVIGLRAWRTGVEDGGTAGPPLQVATVAAGSGLLRVEVEGVVRPLAVGDSVPGGALVRTAAGGTSAGEASPRGALRLEGGAVIRLDGATAARLESSSRIDLLAGAIYADTDPDGAGSTAGTVAESSRALELHTAAGTARDLGTRFMVRVAGESQAPALQVLVRSGAVIVERGGESQTAHGGEQIRTRGGALELAPAPPYGPEWAWVIEAAPPFEVAGRSIAEILDWVSRETGWTVRYEDASLAEAARAMVQQASRPEAGALRPDQAPFALLPGANLDGVLEDGVLTVKRR